MKIRQATKEGYIECIDGGIADLSYPSSTTRRGRVIGGGTIVPTLTTNETEIYVMAKRIRKLTPRECGRLMGVSDDDITKILDCNSNTQAYKQFGNSIVVDVMCHMFRNLNIGGINESEV